MVFPWQGALVFVGITGLPHPDSLYRLTSQLLSKLSINLPADPMAQNQQDADAAVAQVQQVMMIILGTILAIFIAQIIAICMYKSKVHDAKPPLGDNLPTMASGEFHYKLFDCFSNINECLCSFCCSTVRYADTHSATSGGGFWGSFCMFVGVNAVIASAAGAVVTAVMPPPAMPQDLFDSHAVATYQHQVASYQGDHVNNLIQSLLRGLAFGILARSKLRAKLGDPNPGKAASYDFFAWGFCSLCALTQESVEADIAADVTISCPFTLTKGRVRAREVAPNDQENLLGAALLVEGR
jgi:Cys-rich protein (TIGR01571 family)